MSKLSKDILAKIKKENVTPKSRWYFNALHTAIWTAVIVTIVLGSLGIAVAIRHLTLTDWELANQISSNPLNFMPVLWFGIIALAIFIADQIFKKTRKGYKFKVSHVLIASILLSITLGSGFFMVEADQTFENTIRKTIKPYQQWEDKRAAKFVAPQQGVIAGEITHIDLGEEWRVVDFKGKLQAVDIREAQIEPNVDQSIGTKVIVKGKVYDERFKADYVKNFEDTREHLRKRRAAIRRIKETLTDEQKMEIREQLEEGKTYEDIREEIKWDIRENLTEEEIRRFKAYREKMEYEKSYYDRYR